MVGLPLAVRGIQAIDKAATAESTTRSGIARAISTGWLKTQGLPQGRLMLTGLRIRTARKLVVLGGQFICVLALFISLAASQGLALTANELKSRLVGPWELAEAFIENSGVREQPHGQKPLGLAMFHENGSFVMFFSKPDVQKFAGSRLGGTDSENKAAVRGALSYFGSYEAREGNELVLHIKGSTFPNFTGTDQTRRVRFSQEQRLIIFNPNPSTGAGFGASIWRRLPNQ